MEKSQWNWSKQSNLLWRVGDRPCPCLVASQEGPLRRKQRVDAAVRPLWYKPYWLIVKYTPYASTNNSHPSISFHPIWLPQVVYVARNPKDVCVSYYHFAKQLGERFFNGTFDNLLDAFMDNHLFYGAYWDHIRQARQQKDNPNFHMLFYEDLKTNILEELRKLSSFLGLEIDDDTLLKWVVRCSPFYNCMIFNASTMG